MKKPDTACLPFFYDFIIEDNTIYFPLANYNAMCKGSLLNDEIEIAEIFPDVAADQRIAYSGMYKQKDNLLFFPYMRDNHDILIYNIPQKKFSKLSCDKNIFVSSYHVFENNGYIYCVSSMTDTIYKIDLQKSALKCITSKCMADKALITETVRVGDFLFLPLNQKETMLIFDLESETFQYYDYPENLSYISTASYYDGKLWITGKNRRIYVWSIKEKQICEFAEFPDFVHKYNERGDWFSVSFIYQNILWLLPDCASAILKFNMLTGQFEELKISGEEEDGVLGKERFFVTKYSSAKRVGQKVFFLSSKTRILYELNLETNNIRQHLFSINNMYHDQIYPTPVYGKMSEVNYANGLEVLLQYMENSDRKMITKKEIVGEKIYAYIDSETENRK